MCIRLLIKVILYILNLTRLQCNLGIINQFCWMQLSFQRLSGRVVQVQDKPYMIKSFECSWEPRKKRLILDLSFLNNFIKKEKVKSKIGKSPSVFWKKFLYDKGWFKVRIPSYYRYIDIYIYWTYFFRVFMKLKLLLLHCSIFIDFH